MRTIDRIKESDALSGTYLRLKLMVTKRPEDLTEPEVNNKKMLRN